MALSAPTRPVWAASLVLAAIGVLGRFVAIPYISGYAGWWLGLAYLVLLIATSFKGI